MLVAVVPASLPGCATPAPPVQPKQPTLQAGSPLRVGSAGDLQDGGSLWVQGRSQPVEDGKRDLRWTPPGF